METCIFCKIAKGTIPSSKVFENARVLAFLDLNPIALGHTLVVPKVHAETLLDLPADYYADVMGVMAQVGRAVMGLPDVSGFNCLQNNFSVAGQEVMHLHWHVIPRCEGDKILQGRFGSATYGSPEQMQEIAGNLWNSIQKYAR